MLVCNNIPFTPAANIVAKLKSSNSSTRIIVAGINHSPPTTLTAPIAARISPSLPLANAKTKFPTLRFAASPIVATGISGFSILKTATSVVASRPKSETDVLSLFSRVTVMRSQRFNDSSEVTIIPLRQ